MKQENVARQNATHVLRRPADTRNHGLAFFAFDRHECRDPLPHTHKQLTPAHQSTRGALRRAWLLSGGRMSVGWCVSTSDAVCGSAAGRCRFVSRIYFWVAGLRDSGEINSTSEKLPLWAEVRLGCVQRDLPRQVFMRRRT